MERTQVPPPGGYRRRRDTGTLQAIFLAQDVPPAGCLRFCAVTSNMTRGARIRCGRQRMSLADHGYLVYPDPLYGLDGSFKPQPQLAAGYCLRR